MCRRIPLATVWYIEYGDQLGVIDPNQVYDDVLAEIKSRDPDAYIVDYKQYPYQIAFKVVHPDETLGLTPEELKLAKQGKLIAPALVALIVGIVWGIAAIIGTAGFLVNALTAHHIETSTYADKDPDTGEEVIFPSYTGYRAWLVAHYPESAQYLDSVGATNWWEGITSFFKLLPVLLVFVGVMLIVPPILRLIPKPKKE